MANYCTSDDIIRELPYITIDSSSKPSKTEVDLFCTDISVEIDARLRAAGITVPVTDEDLKKVLLSIAINGVAAKVLRANPNGEFENAQVYQQLYQNALRSIEERPAILREVDNPGRPGGSVREDEDIKFTRLGEEW